MKIRQLVLSAPLFLFFPLFAYAAIFELASTLTPGAEVPLVTTASGASGTAAMALDDDSGMFTWIITFEGLTGPATAAHFHEAPRGAAGGVALAIDDSNDPHVDFSGVGRDAGIFSGSTTLDAASVTAILNNNWYINIHTGQNPGGEIRGQVLGGTFSPVPIPAAAWLLFSGLAGLLIIKPKTR